VSISPDGTKFAHFTRRGDALVAVVKTFPGGDVVQEFALPDGYFAVPDIIWSSDGGSLTYAAVDSNAVGNLWQQPLTGGPPKQLTNYTSDEIFYFNFSPDGTQLAIVRGSWRHDVVLATLGSE
jgi:Tol biopolymer transport system component